MFDYPFEKRRSKLAIFHVDTAPPVADYDYPHQNIQFMISQVCLEKGPFEDLKIWNPIYEKAKEIISNGHSGDDSEHGEFSCDSGAEPFNKLKYKETSSEAHNLLESYDMGVIDDKILLQLQIGLSAYKFVSQRSTTTALDLFGDLGGFHQSVDFSVFMIGEWFAFKFFVQHISNSLYLRKKTTQEMENDGVNEEA